MTHDLEAKPRREVGTSERADKEERSETSDDEEPTNTSATRSMASFSMAHALAMVKRRQEQGSQAKREQELMREREAKEKFKAKRLRRRQNQKLAKAKARAHVEIDDDSQSRLVKEDDSVEGEDTASLHSNIEAPKEGEPRPTKSKSRKRGRRRTPKVQEGSRSSGPLKLRNRKKRLAACHNFISPKRRWKQPTQPPSDESAVTGTKLFMPRCVAVKLLNNPNNTSQK